MNRVKESTVVLLMIWTLTLPVLSQEYEQKLEKGNKSAQQIHENAKLEHGKLLLEQGLSYEAIRELEKIWQHDDYPKDNPEVYSLLALAYRRVGRNEDALQALETSIACHPSDLDLWAQRSALITSGLANRGKRVFSPPWIPVAPDQEALQRVLYLGPPGGWSKVQVPEMARIYIKYSVALNRAGWTNAVHAFISIALPEALGPALESCNTSDATACLNELAALTGNSSFSQMPSEVRSYALWLAARKHAVLGNYLHSVDAIQDLVDLGGADLPYISVRGFVENLQRYVFASVSFDLATGALRHPDPTNFLSPDDLKTEEELARRPSEDKLRQQKNDPTFRYGMVNDEEDQAEIFATLMESWDEPMRSRLLTLLATRIHERKFELPVKFLLHQYAEVVMDWPISSKDDTLRKRLDEALRKTSPEDIPDSIELGYQVALRLEKLRKYWSMRRPEKEVP